MVRGLENVTFGIYFHYKFWSKMTLSSRKGGQMSSERADQLRKKDVVQLVTLLLCIFFNIYLHFQVQPVPRISIKQFFKF